MGPNLYEILGFHSVRQTHNRIQWRVDKIIQNYTKEDKEFLKSLPLDIIKLDTWQSNKNWKNCTTEKELHTCGTTYCVRGYAEAKYFVENGKQVEDVNTLYPNLKHLFFMTDDQFLKEREYILNS